MKNFQKIALGLLVGIMAIGFSAFKSTVNANTKFAQQTKIYYHVGDEYVLTPPEDTSCAPDDNIKCRLTYSGSTLPPNSSYPENAFPTSGYTLVQSTQAGSYQ